MPFIKGQMRFTLPPGPPGIHPPPAALTRILTQNEVLIAELELSAARRLRDITRR